MQLVKIFHGETFRVEREINEYLEDGYVIERVRMTSNCDLIVDVLVIFAKDTQSKSQKLNEEEDL